LGRHSICWGDVEETHCPEIALPQADCRFFIPLHPGDTARSEFRMKNSSPKESTRLGEGFFITTDRLSYNQGDERVRTQEFVVFHYRP
jgi:acyl dehydratase